jgi:hypothetical protein
VLAYAMGLEREKAAAQRHIDNLKAMSDTIHKACTGVCDRAVLEFADHVLDMLRATVESEMTVHTYGEALPHEPAPAGMDSR